MKKTILPFLLALGLAQIISGQPSPCVNPAMTSTCSPACVICDINGFTGINSSQIQGQAPPGFCTSQVHHMQWIAFIAGSTSLTLEVDVFNCQDGEGLEIGIYRSLNCQTFQLVSNCDTDIPPNTTGTFTNTVPLEIGQYYYFVMDGSNDDVCQYTVHVIAGTTEVPPLPNSGLIGGDTVVCSETTELYSVIPPVGATRFEWTLNGSAFSLQTDTIPILWSTPGAYELCVTSSNACDTALPNCRIIVVNPTAQTQLSATICGGACVDIADTTLCAAGIYNFQYAGFQGCDSLVQVVVEEISSVTTNLDLLLCEGDSIFVGSQAFFASGQFQEVLVGFNGCDSIINLALEIIDCQIQGNLVAAPADCHGAATGRLDFSIQGGTPPFQYTWMRVGAAFPSGAGAVDALFSLETLDNLPPGTYSVVVTDGFGNSEILFAQITEPPPLTAILQASQVQGFNLGCHGDTDGSLVLLPGGGTPPYQVQWNTGAQGPTLTNIGAGIYSGTLTDAGGCSKLVQDTLTEPDPLVLEAQFDSPGCAGASTGAVRVLATSGGVPPYAYDLSGAGFGPAEVFNGLLPGSYDLTVRDAGGCELSQSGMLLAPLIPEIDLGPDLTIDLGEAAAFELIQNSPLNLFEWSALPGLSCYDCPEPTAAPYRTTTYVLTVTAPGGCTDSDEIRVDVLEKRDVYVPNSFSPNDDGLHDNFTVYGGLSLLRVRYLEVYSRWGELIFRQDDLPFNQDSSGWDGDFRGRPMPPGVFAWMAEVEFVDGVVRVLKGDVQIVR